VRAVVGAHRSCLSSPAEAASRPSGLNDAQRTQFPWLPSVQAKRCEGRLHS